MYKSCLFLAALLRPEGLRERSPIPIKIGKTNENHARREIMKPLGLFLLMLNMASGIARGRVMSPTTVSRQYGDLNYESLMTLDIQ